ncbi:hypothetical protein ACFQY4_35090 [Catellatospora bangladeshensis]|uniref:Uncharacterized protein n=1 Tax=Catellatospora bangladeshensis TaxID=310355 RepID=A0A8J3JHQ8_9ACTN|nr:hypothetical protein [Catellatospora bangladeshensis]GIF80873.1 hypothetical protein Cba03nite_22220 [Catellatospora bangladeshensis]
MTMRIGYSMWGFLGPGVIDTSDNSRAYRRALLDRFTAEGHQIVLLQRNRDLLEAGLDLTSTYRWESIYFPDLDALILEWRWPTERNLLHGFTRDTEVHRQAELLDWYTRERATPTLIWDLHRQLSADDPLRVLPNVAVGETTPLATPGARWLACPVPDQLLDIADTQRLARKVRELPLAYVGNQHGGDLDEHFERFFSPAAELVQHQVAGNWPKAEAWPHVEFVGPIAFGEVERMYCRSLATVLLQPERLWRVGHLSSRWWEALLAGCIPLAPIEMRGADVYLPRDLHVTDGQDVIDRLAWLRSLAGTREHADLLTACFARLEPFRCSLVARQALSMLEAVS